MTDEYGRNLKDGNEFQDFVVDEMLKRGIPIVQYTSRKWQLNKGESASGIEIKYDRRFQETGNLYIEVEEKSNKNNPFYVKSGILRDDNTDGYLIGDYTHLYWLSKRALKKVYMSIDKWGFKKTQTATSRGFLLPLNSKAFEWVLYKDIPITGDMPRE